MEYEMKNYLNEKAYYGEKMIKKLFILIHILRDTYLYINMYADIRRYS